MRLIRRADQQEMPWKNGGGTTREIACHPAGAGLGDFSWRISVALVASNGPFSTFSGIDRILTLIEGDGMILEFAGGRAVRLTPTDPPLSFLGDEPCSARLLDGPIRDLNVMTRRGAWRGEVELVSTATAVSLAAKDGSVLAYLIEGEAHCADVRMMAGDVLWLMAGEVPAVLTPAPDARIAIIRVQPSPA